MIYIFWASAFLIAYVYVGYPALLAVWSRVRSGSAPAAPAGALPSVSIVVAAKNEARRLAARVQNLLALDYPADRRQIIVVSDGSTDGTLRVLRPFAGCIEIVSISASGKAAALNAGVARAKHEILVFADAR